MKKFKTVGKDEDNKLRLIYSQCLRKTLVASLVCPVDTRIPILLLHSHRVWEKKRIVDQTCIKKHYVQRVKAVFVNLTITTEKDSMSSSPRRK